MIYLKQEEARKNCFTIEPRELKLTALNEDLGIWFDRSVFRDTAQDEHALVADTLQPECREEAVVILCKAEARHPIHDMPVLHQPGLLFGEL